MFDLGAWLLSARGLTDPQGAQIAQIVDEIADARLVFLGETNHFVREKTDFRLWWLTQLAARKPLVVGEEIASLDGVEIDRFIRDGNPRHLDRVATFGYEGRRHPDRDDWPPVFSTGKYPHRGMRLEHERLYAALRELDGVVRFFGFDIDADGAGDVERRAGESLREELDRLSAMDDPPRSQIESLRYLSLMEGATEFEQTREAMAYRETVMKQRVAAVLDETDESHLVVLMAHGFHLAKDDDGFAETDGVGPGGGQTASLGHYFVKEQGYDARSVWMLYGAGEDSQPIEGLPNRFDYPASTLNAKLGAALDEVALLPDIPPGSVDIGHLYNAIASVELTRQADCAMFFPRVSPLPT